jgi:hypothetical protein
MSGSSYYNENSRERLNGISRLLLLISIGFFIAASLINTIYTLTAHYSVLFKVGIFIVILFDIFYAAIILSIYSSGKFDITNRFIFMSLILFTLIFISELILSVSTGSTIFPAIVGFVALAFGYMYYFFKDDELISRIMIIIAAMLAYIAMIGYPLPSYIFIFGTSYLNSALWAQAFIAMELLLILAFIFKPTAMISDFISGSAKPLAMFIFGIGLIITGASMAAYSVAGFPAALGDLLTGILIIAGILALIAGILFIIMSIMEFYDSVIKPRIHFIR